jgi:hypothetical protein
MVEKMSKAISSASGTNHWTTFDPETKTDRHFGKVEK